jgi:hypothetical protein
MSANADGQDLAESLKSRVRVLQIVVAALAGGVLAYAGVAIYLRTEGNVQPVAGAASALTFAALCIVPLALFASRLLPAAVARGARQRIASGQFNLAKDPRTGAPDAFLTQFGDAGKLWLTYQTGTILGAAVLEGTALLSITAYLLGGHVVALGFAAGLVMVMFSSWPTAAKAARWIEEQQKLMREEKSLGR